MANEEIKEVIKNFVDFDIENKYYQKEQKEEMLRNFKKIVYEDDVTIRQFLKAFFKESQKLAEEYSLIANEGEAEEINVDDETEENLDVEQEVELSDEKEETPQVPESVYNFYRSKASDILYE